MNSKKLIVGILAAAAIVAIIVAALLLAPHASAPASEGSLPSPSGHPAHPMGDATLSGTVNVNGKPGSGVAVQFLYTTGQPVGSTKTDSAGHYKVSIPPGTYVVSAKSSSYAKTATVTVTAGQQATQDLNLGTN